MINQNIEIILQNLHKDKPFFLFINCPETHIPYNCPVSQNIDENYIKLISKIYSLDFIKNIDKKHPVVLSTEERNIILNQQQKSLEWIDQQLSILVNKLPQNGLETLVIVLSDHGEELGEGGRIGHAHVHQTVIDVPIWCGILRRQK